WIAVCRAFFRRYSNPYATHVLSEDTLYQEVRETSLFSTRIFRKRATASLSGCARKLLNNPQVLPHALL
ncbi:Protein preli-like protein, partial [Ooceraea biroi]